ncbi:MAG: BtpA/SgcQ family protein [Chloroflexota bacterium]
MQKKLLPVIHVLNAEQAVANADIAFESGCDGVFLINHEDEHGVRKLNFEALLSIHAVVRQHFPHKFMGVNCLDLEAAEVFQYLNEGVSAVWVDNAEIDEHSENQIEADKILRAKHEARWNGMYFGGVAFKYQRNVDNLEAAAKIASNYVDVITTSGPATGQAASISKIRQIKQTINEIPLAIASGITAENVTNFLPWVDYFLVATGISQTFYHLDQQKITELAQIIHRY